MRRSVSLLVFGWFGAGMELWHIVFAIFTDRIVTNDYRLGCRDASFFLGNVTGVLRKQHAAI
jgi:hypothetical protein